MVAERKTFNAWQEDIGSLYANTFNAMLTACKKWTLFTGELNTPLKLTNFWYKVQIWAFEETKVDNDASTNLKASSLSDIIYQYSVG